MEYNFQNIAERIRELRKNAGVSQDALISKLAENFKFHIGRNTLSKIENGEREYYSFQFLYYFAKLFDCDIGYILGEYDEKKYDVHFISEYTGLSEKAIENLCEWSSQIYPEIDYSIINSILTSNNFLYLIDCISNYKTNQVTLEDFKVAFGKIERSRCDIEDDVKSSECDIEVVEDNTSLNKSVSPFERAKRRDLYMFRIQEAFRRIVEKDVKNNG